MMLTSFPDKDVSVRAGESTRHATPLVTASPKMPVVLTFAVARAERVARIVQQLYPNASVHVDKDINALIVLAEGEELTGIRAIVTGLDVRSPADSLTEAIQLRGMSAGVLAARLGPVFRHARFTETSKQSIVVTASAQDLAQIRAVIAAVDAVPVSATPRPTLPVTAIHVQQGDVHAIARAVARSFLQARVAVAGPNIIVSGDPDATAQAKAMIASLDGPAREVQFTQLYRLRFVDAASVAALLSRSFRAASFEVDKNLNAITVLANGIVQQRIADAVTQLDASPSAAGGGGGSGVAQGGPMQTEVVSLHAATPPSGNGPSTTANDIAQTVTQSLQGTVPDLHIVVHPNSTRLVLTGSSYSIGLAKDLIAKLDVAEPLVELDTQVLEVDEGVQKQLGFRFPAPALATTFGEVQPVANADGTIPRLIGLQAISRTPLTLGAQLDFLISTNRARILEDPRITTFSGRTASLRAGATVNILTTTGGGTGTVATTQVQSFQTGVTLDITPIVNTDDYITVTLHPSVNSEAGIGTGGVPNIQTRDTTTTVGLHDGETIVVGGLIEDSSSRNVQKIPFLGDLPLIGRFFQDVGVSHTRNELVVTVTPHILRDSQRGVIGHPILTPAVPDPLPTLRAEATLPPVRANQAPEPASPPPPTLQPTMVPELGPADLSATPVAGGPRNASTSPDAPAPAPVVSATNNPNPLPTAFAQTNTYTFGAAPANNYADANQPPQIFFVQAQPTVVKNGTAVTISVITTTNVSSLSFGPTPTTPMISLGSIAPGKWQSTFSFNTAGLQSVRGNVNELLTATNALGAYTSLRVPFSLIP